MRALFLFVLLANVAFFAYAHWLRAPDDGGKLIPRLQVNPERIKIIEPSEKVRTGGAPVGAVLRRLHLGDALRPLVLGGERRELRAVELLASGDVDAGWRDRAGGERAAQLLEGRARFGARW